MKFKNKKPVIIVFHKDKDKFVDGFSVIYDTYSTDNEKIRIYDVLVNQYPEVPGSYNITSFPATMYIPVGGKPIITQGYTSTKDAVKDAREQIVTK